MAIRGVRITNKCEGFGNPSLGKLPVIPSADRELPDLPVSTRNNLPPPEIIRGMVSWFTLTLGIKPLYFAWNYANSIMGRIIEVAINAFSSSRSFASSLNAVKSPVTTTLYPVSHNLYSVLRTCHGELLPQFF